jgi:hypothetical protein
MPVSIKQFPGESIILITMTPPLASLLGHDVGFMKVASLLQNIPGPVFLIADFSAITLDMRHLVLALDQFSNSFGAGLIPQARFSVVTTDYLVKLGLETLEHYHQFHVHVFDTLDSALSHARQEL